MQIEFDPVKDAANIAKHGVSLSLAEHLDVVAYVDDLRFAEPRFRLYGYIDDLPYCAAGTLRNGVVRVISLRRAHAKEMKRHDR